MPYSGVIEDVKRAIQGQRPKRMPFLAHSEEMDVRVAGEVYENYCSDSRIIEKVQTHVIERFGYDWAWLQIDDCILYELLGVGVVGEGNILRATRDYLPATRATLDRLKKPNVRKDGRCPTLLEAIRRLKDRYGESILVVGRTEGPFSSVTLLYGIDKTMLLMYDNPDLLRDTMKFFVDLQIEFGNAQFEAGADALWYGDCNASSHIMSLQTYQDFAVGPLAEVVAGYQGNGLTFLHASEQKTKYVDAMAGTGAEVVSLDPGADLAACREVVKGRCAIMGNLDPIAQLMNGTPESVSAQTEEILTTVSIKGGHLINSGEMVPRDTPEENMMAFGETVRRVWPKLLME